MKPRKLFSIIEQFAPPQFAESWDHCGIQVAAHRDTLTHLAVGLDPSPAFIREALALGADVCLTHHPLYFKPIAPDATGDYFDVLHLLMCADAWLYSAHTSLDCQLTGPPGWLADVLDLQNRRPLSPVNHPDAPPHLGIGLVGDLQTPALFSDFFGTLSNHIGRTRFAMTGIAPESVRRVAYCPGSGSSLAREAFDCGADVYITGDVKYHTALDVFDAGCMIDVGHFSLEERMTRIFAETLAAALEKDGVTVSFIPGRDPINIVEAPSLGANT
ncbi:Nif3-like dinuclear metal center hexameric protein [Desulfovibrio inopinatus]|uniref:Nif3-like dinuclear metal center hexameric protein n=1 Tax=Desulfovibrio inopinatus TaxID=102109 RepID=UPI000554F0C5|nr:Nif3-like dinuclear metal center hexameric protein [Desulfovibrio inopinatus]